MAKMTVAEAFEVGVGSVADVAIHHHEQMLSGEALADSKASFITRLSEALSEPETAPHALAIACAVVNQFFMETGLLVYSTGTGIEVMAKDIPLEAREVLIARLFAA